jgi:hypothetical protein
MTCDKFFEVQKSDQYKLSNFVFENITLNAKGSPLDESQVEGFTVKNVNVSY